MGEHYLCTKCGGELHCSCAAPPTPTDRERDELWQLIYEWDMSLVGAEKKSVRKKLDDAITALRAREQRLEDAYIREMRHSVTLGQRTERLEAALRDYRSAVDEFLAATTEALEAGMTGNDPSTSRMNVARERMRTTRQSLDRALAGTTEG